MPIYDTDTYTFAWKGKIYGAGTIVVFNDEFIEKFRWCGEKICKRGSFYNTYSNNGKEMFQFEKYCPECWLSDNFPIAFSFTELELLEAIEDIERPVPVIQITAAEPPSVKEKLNKDCESFRNFFIYKEAYFGSKTKIYITDEFMELYYKKTNKRLTKKISFSFSVMNDKTKVREYCLANCEDIKDKSIQEEYETVFTLSEEEFYNAIECIKEPYTIKHKDRDEPIIFILFIILLFLIWFSYKMFIEPAPIIMVLIFVFLKLRKMILYQ